MKYFLLLVFLACNFINAQTYRIMYEYRFAPLKAKPDSLVTDYMNLDTDGRKSYFYNAAKRDYDSLAALKKTLPTGKRHNININYSIIKDLNGATSMLETNYQGTMLNVPETEPVKWKLTKDFATFGKWKIQKANAEYKGRSWEAWFAPEMPFSDGPYKFSGLPGLIVKLNDTGHEHNFELTGLKKLPKIYFVPAKDPKILSAEKYAALPPFFNHAEYIEAMNVTEAGLETKMKDGSTIFMSRSIMKGKPGSTNDYFNKKLGAGDNPIERRNTR